MDYISDQIKFHEDIINVHTLHINNLKKYICENHKIDKIPISSSVSEKENVDYETKDLSSLLAFDNDLIWSRIRNAHNSMQNIDDANNDLDQLPINSEVPTQHQLHNKSTQIAAVKENNLLVSMPEIKLTNNLESDLKNNPYMNNIPKITKLSRFTQKKQNQIIKNIFIKATENINKLSELDSTILNNLDANIQTEADRLLNIYLDE